MFEISGLSISYGSVEVVHGVSMRVDKGQIVALIGPNGAGKSSVLKAVSGLIRPTAGEILFLGASLIGVPPHEIAASGVAHVMEGRRLFGGLTVEDNLLLAGSDDEKASAGNIEAVYQRWPRLRERRDQLAGTLSGGEQQMLAIGRALMTRPRLLMLDEPSWGLAPLIVRDLMHAFSGLRDQGMTILLVEQMANLALQICDYAYVMTTGQVVLEGSSEDLLSNPDLQATYLGGETGNGPRPAARLERGDVPRPEPPPARERLPKESPRQPRAAAGQFSDPLAPLTVPQDTSPVDVPGTGALAERERLRQLREQAFRSNRSPVEGRQEIVSLRQDLSTLTADRTETERSYAAAPPADDLRAREKIRVEKAAAHASPSGGRAVTEPGLERSGTAFPAREAARRTRQTEFGRPGLLQEGGGQPAWATREERRKQRQKEMEKSGVSGTEPRPGRVGSEPTDYREGERARREREAAMRRTGNASEPES